MGGWRDIWEGEDEVRVTWCLYIHGWQKMQDLISPSSDLSLSTL